MRYTLLFALALLLFPLALGAQHFRALRKAATKALRAKDYYSAMEYARMALEKAPGDGEAQFTYAEAARAYKAFDIAEGAYRDLLVSPARERFPQARFYLGEVLRSQGRYLEAERAYGEWLSTAPQSALAETARLRIEQCRWAERKREGYEDKPSEVSVQALKKSVNTPHSEFAPLMRGDTLYYTSFRFPNRTDTHDPARRISKVLYSVRAARGRTLPRRFNESDKHTAHLTFSPRGDRLYYTICEYLPDQVDIRCTLYERRKDRRGRWAKPKKLPEPLNLEGYTSTHPHCAYDERLQSEVLYFVSDRPEGQGGQDLWYCPRDSTGAWGTVQNLTELNSVADELSPFYDPHTQQLSFASEGHGGFGGVDLFRSEWSAETGQWAAPQNLGLPFNSSYDDLYLSYTADTTVAYLVSNREGTQYLDRANKSCCYDIFRVKMPVADEPLLADSVVVLAEAPDSLWTDPISASLEPALPAPKPEPTTLEDFLPLALYFDNDEPDRRTRRTTTRKTYGESFDRYYAQKATYLSEYTRGLEEEERWTAEERMEAVIREEGFRHCERLGKFSEILLERLEAGEKVEIFIKGFTSPRANSDYNLRLGQRRISSVRNHFFQYREGIFLPYLNRGQLILSEKSFGETSADQSVSADLADRRNSIYSIGAARERRVEILEVIRDKFEKK